MSQMKTPGVYIQEKDAFSSSIVQVATAVPAFIGYTETADNNGKSLLNKACRITSMAEFKMFFGGAPSPMFSIDEKATGSSVKPALTQDGKEYVLNQSNTKYSLYYNMMLFFYNGGGPCYVVSVGNYTDDMNAATFKSGIEVLVKEQEPTMVVTPEAVSLTEDDCISVQQAALAHCGSVMRNRVAILDVWGGYKDREDLSGDCIANFRNNIGKDNLDFSAAYYPWLNTSIVQDNELTFANISNKDVLVALLTTEVSNANAQKQQMLDEIAKINKPLDAEAQHLLHETLAVISPMYNTLLANAKLHMNLLPPSASMAGVYTMVDECRGVWKSPANVSLNGVISPAVNISHDDQEDLNVTTDGKSINAIRSFTGEGTLVWGARTLNGNSLDWRYIAVRRTMIMIEESIRHALKAYVFEPNDANTWTAVSSMITNFLTGLWKQGGLAGATPTDAFEVQVGLGSTMTSVDILEGILKVTVLVAISRPAEFIEITFQQQMQKS